MKGLFGFYLFVFGSVALGWYGMVYVPYQQVGKIGEYNDETTGMVLPPGESGSATRGREVYISNGCVYCHTQQVRPAYQGGDIERGWGVRRSVARDYLGHSPALIGYYRIGPDLSNVGAPREEEIEIEVEVTDEEGNTTVEKKTETSEVLEKDAAWHHRHLYDPRSIHSWSLMPSFRHLYKIQKIVGAPSPDALELEGDAAPGEGYEIVPTEKASALVDYLLSLDQRYPLPEAK
jgi:cytochrome c oxidase cbb3-type subunit 2